MPNNLVKGITQDLTGFIWIATDGGISRFDGKNFVNFKKELPFDKTITVEQLNDSLKNERESTANEKEEFLNLEEWIKNNPKKKEISIVGIEDEIDELKLKISQLEGLLDTFKGKKCQTCGHVHEKSNPHKEEDCLEEIKIKKALLQHKQAKIKENNESITHNTKCQNNSSKYVILKQSLTNRKDKISN